MDLEEGRKRTPGRVIKVEGMAGMPPPYADDHVLNTKQVVFTP